METRIFNQEMTNDDRKLFHYKKLQDETNEIMLKGEGEELICFSVFLKLPMELYIEFSSNEKKTFKSEMKIFFLQIT